MSRRARQRQAARPWKQPQPEPVIDWSALAADLKRRETNPVLAGRTKESP